MKTLLLVTSLDVIGGGAGKAIDGALPGIGMACATASVWALANGAVDVEAVCVNSDGV